MRSDNDGIPDTIPRIDAWNDDFVDAYMVKFARFKNVEVNVDILDTSSFLSFCFSCFYLSYWG